MTVPLVLFMAVQYVPLFVWGAIPFVGPGGMFTNFVILFPSIGKTLEPPLAGKLVATVMKRFRILVYVSMAVFLLTGVTMASMRLDSGEFFSSRNEMMAILIIKVPLFILMLILAIAAFEIVAPRVARLESEGPSPRLQKARRSQKIIAITGFILGVLVIALSAML